MIEQLLFNSRHTFKYEIYNSQLEDVPNNQVLITLKGEQRLPDMLEMFHKYLKAVGYFPPDNSHLEFVSNS